MQATLPDNEADRLDALKAYGILDTPPGQYYDDITELAAGICNTPIAMISLIDESRQWIKSKVGLSLSAIPRQDSFCAHAILHPDEILVVPDALDDLRFADNPLVTGEPPFRSYAGVPLVTKDGAALGTLCVVDTRPRELGGTELSALRNLARLTVAQLENSRTVAELQECHTQLARTNQDLLAQNSTDELTQLKSFRAFQQALGNEWERTFRHSNPLSLMIIDIDQFKPYRDTFGRLATDKALQMIAGMISHGARQLDVFARYADDEFVVVLPETDSEGALQIAERIRYRIEQQDWPNRPLTVSIGVASYNGQADADAMLAQADEALHRAKQAGRNCAMLAT